MHVFSNKTSQRHFFFKQHFFLFCSFPERSLQNRCTFWGLQYTCTTIYHQQNDDDDEDADDDDGGVNEITNSYRVSVIFM